VHPHLSQTLTSERIKGWQEEAARARLAREARGARRARRGRRRWGAWRIRVPATTALASPSSGPTPPASPVTGQRAAEGRPARLAGWDDELLAAAAGEHRPMIADEGRPAGAGERRPTGTRAA
jgi:hypothetical protein